MQPLSLPSATRPEGPRTALEWLVLTPRSPLHRRLGRALLAEAAAEGGSLRELASGELLLGAAPALLDRLMPGLWRVLGAESLSRRPQCPPGSQPLAAAPPHAPPPQPGAPGMAAPERVPQPFLEEVLERLPIVGLAPGGLPRLAGLHLKPSRAGLLRLGQGLPPHLLGHMGEDTMHRAFQALADPAQRQALLGAVPAVPLHLDMRPADLAALPGWPGDLPLLPVLPLAVLAGPVPSLPFALSGLEAASLALCDAGNLPGAALHLRWTPGLAALPPDSIAALDPGRLVLDEVEDEAALAWGLSRGIGRFTGAQPSRLLAVVRRRDCAFRQDCSTATCAASAAGLSPRARSGCAAPQRLIPQEEAP